MNAGGAYVLGGAKTFPQLSGPLFSWLAAGVPAGGSRFRWRGGACGAGGDGKERVREHGQGDVPVPGAVAADLVVVQPGLVLGLGEAVLNSPPGSRYRRELGERDRAGRPAAVKGQLKLAFLTRLQGPADQQPVPAAVRGDHGPVVKPWPFRTVRAAQPLPMP